MNNQKTSIIKEIMMSNNKLFTPCSCEACYIHREFKILKISSSCYFVKIPLMIDHGSVTFHHYCPNETYGKILNDKYNIRYKAYKEAERSKRREDLNGKSLDLIFDDLPNNHKDFFIFHLDLFR